MPITKISFAAGIDKQDSPYGAEGRWIDSDYARFRYGLPEKIGGWTPYSTSNLIGVARDIWTWTALDGDWCLAIGTNRKLYVLTGGAIGDITPIRRTDVGVTITPANGTTVITVTLVGHGASVGDFVTFSSTTNPFGGSAGTVFNIEYEILSATTANTFTVQSPVTLTNSVAGTASMAFQISIGAINSVTSPGWGTGAWSAGTWGTPRTAIINTVAPRIWSLDNFGEDLTACQNGGSIYVWSPTSGVSVRATIIAAAPTKNTFALTSTPDRHLVLFGSETTIGSSATFDPMLVRFSEAENYSIWAPTATNTAGSQRLSDGNKLVTAVRSKGQVLVMTDNAIYGMQFLGPPYTFGFQQLGTNCGAVSNNAAEDINGVCYWMSQDAFYVFDGTVKKLPCSVQDDVFQDFNTVQQEKVYCGLNTEFNEVTWFYPTSSSDEINAYVSFNYLENCWYQGTMARTSWRDRGVFSNPLATYWLPNSVASAYPSVSGLTNGVTTIYNHEDGVNGDGAAITSYVESGFFDIGDGDSISFIRALVPDFSNQAGTLSFLVTTRPYSVGPSVDSSLSPYTLTSTTAKIDTRIRGRAISIKIRSTAIGDDWRFGTLRADIQPDGLR